VGRGHEGGRPRRAPRHRSRGTGVRRPRTGGMSVPWPKESAVSSFRSSDAATGEHATLRATAPGDLGAPTVAGGRSDIGEFREGRYDDTCDAIGER
jgi:hypothetical protein